MIGRFSSHTALHAISVSALALLAGVGLAAASGAPAALIPFFPAILALTHRSGPVPAIGCAVLGVLAWTFALIGLEHRPAGQAVLTAPNLLVLGGFLVSAAFIIVLSRRYASPLQPGVAVFDAPDQTDTHRARGTNEDTLRKLSHELRSPLSAIIGWAQVLRAQGPPQQMVHGLEVIERNARAQTRIIEDLLEGRSSNSSRQRTPEARDPARAETNIE